VISEAFVTEFGKESDIDSAQTSEPP
jgi:hypothetical protein